MKHYSHWDFWEVEKFWEVQFGRLYGIQKWALSVWPGASVKGPVPRGLLSGPGSAALLDTAGPLPRHGWACPSLTTKSKLKPTGALALTPICAMPGLGRRYELCKLGAAGSLKGSQCRPRRLQEASSLLEDGVCALSFQETPRAARPRRVGCLPALRLLCCLRPEGPGGS